MGFTSLKANQLVTSPINYKSVTAHSCACLLDKLAVQNRKRFLAQEGIWDTIINYITHNYRIPHAHVPILFYCKEWPEGRYTDAVLITNHYQSTHTSHSP